MQIGAQLYTLRTYLQNEADIRISLKKVAEMGYKVVQVSGLGPIDPRVLREICDENGLKIALTHVSADRILYDTEKLIEEHNILGCDYIGLGGMPDKYRTDFWVEQFAKDFMEPAKKIAAAGKYFMYHNHAFEFERLPNGKLFLEVLMETMPAELMGFTIDTYWVQAGGADPVQWIERLKDRIPCVHFKDMSALSNNTTIMAPVGEGNLNWPAIIAKLEELGTTKYALVEQDTCRESPFVCLQKSHDNLIKFGCHD